MTGTGLLTARCDPFGAESRVQLLGGLYPESHVGKIMWHCSSRADGRWRMTCTGGAYGERRAPDGGLVAAYSCDGGHQGQVMPLCLAHVAMLRKRSAGLCPACAWPPKARALTEAMQARQGDIAEAARLGLYAAAARLQGTLEQLQAGMNEMVAAGLVHKCPLRLTEVS